MKDNKSYVSPVADILSCDNDIVRTSGMLRSADEPLGAESWKSGWSEKIRMVEE